MGNMLYPTVEGYFVQRNDITEYKICDGTKCLFSCRNSITLLNGLEPHIKQYIDNNKLTTTTSLMLDSSRSTLNKEGLIISSHYGSNNCYFYSVKFFDTGKWGFPQGLKIEAIRERKGSKSKPVKFRSSEHMSPSYPGHIIVTDITKFIKGGF
jgi:hypothetical protein